MWNQVKCFTYEESFSMVGYYTIKPIHDNFYLLRTEGSYNIICARLMGLSYAQYLRFCRDVCGAELYGKDSKYPVAYFKKDVLFLKLISLLNHRANLVLWEREHPNWKKHQEFVKRVEDSKKIAEELSKGERNG